MQEAIPPTSPGSWRTILPISPFPQHRQELQPQLYLTPSRTTTSHFPSQDQAGQECLEMETEGCLERPRAANMGHESAGLRLSVRVDFGGHGMAQDPLSTVEHGRERLSLDDTSPYYWALVLANNSSGHFPPIKSTIGGCGIPQGLLNLHRAYGGARSWHGTSAHRQACATTNNVSRPLLVNRVIDRRSWYTARSIRKLSNIGKRPLLNSISPRRQPRIPSNSPPQSLPGNKLVYQPTESTQQ
ncbi:hypothetical protein D6C93_04352 [Aureobasidium pullulans]|nr:hypothetical protein D6C93_04352 [Aureobasidium pullulans]